MDTVASLITYIATFFDGIWEWLNVTIVQMLKDFVEWLITSMTIGWIETKIYLLGLAWSVAENVITAFSVGPLISSALSGLSPTVAYWIDAFGILSGLSLVMQAYVASFVLRMVGF